MQLEVGHVVTSSFINLCKYVYFGYAMLYKGRAQYAYLGRQKTILVWFLFYIHSSFKRKVHSLHLCVAQAHPQRANEEGSRRHGDVTVASGMTGSGAKGRSEGPGTD